MKRLLLLVLASLLWACATPSAVVLIDPVDGKTIIRQPPVDARSSLIEPIHMVGFEWYEKFPEKIFITVEVALVTQSIQMASFNADGRIVENLKLASTGMQFGGSSSRRFEIRFEEFLAIANARVVRLRVEGFKTYTVSSFGPDAGRADVNHTFAPFLEKVAAARSRTMAPVRAP